MARLPKGVARLPEGVARLPEPSRLDALLCLVVSHVQGVCSFRTLLRISGARGPFSHGPGRERSYRGSHGVKGQSLGREDRADANPEDIRGAIQWVLCGQCDSLIQGPVPLARTMHTVSLGLRGAAWQTTAALPSWLENYSFLPGSFNLP